MAKLTILCLLVAFLASVSCHGWHKFGFWKRQFQNLNCRVTHRKSVVDEDDHVIKCVDHCGEGYEEKYSFKFGHYCRELPEGCAERNCRRCLSGYLLLRRKYLSRSRCVKDCPRGFEQKDRKCLELPRGCKDMTCSACIDGFFYHPQPLYFGTKCRTRCPTGYEGNVATNKCDRKTIKEGCEDYYCYRCSKGYYKTTEDYRHKCVTKCPAGSGPVQGRCKNIPRGCENAVCSNCTDGYFHYEKAIYFQACQQSCPVGYFEDSETNRCVACKVDYCSECDTSAEQCEKCNKYKALLVENTVNGTTTECVYTCPKGYKKIFDYSHMMRVCDKIIKPTEPVKEVIPEGCQDRSCQQCISGYFKLVVAPVSSCVKQCPSGYFTGQNNCTRCAEPRCNVCSDSPFQCNICKPGYLSKHTEMGNQTVKCLTQCPEGYSPVVQNDTVWCEKKPTPECKITNCEKCTSHHVQSHHAGCVECKAGYFLKRNIFRDECVSFCPDRFYAGVKPGTKISACLACSTQFCKRCVSRKKCSECFEPFVLDFTTGNCKLCKTGRVYNTKTKSCVDIQTATDVTVESLIN